VPLGVKAATAPPAEPSPAPPNLFGHALLARQWGRIGTPGRIRLDAHPAPGAAINAVARLARSKRRRGYQDRPA
jgi:predicted DNA-binding WGR domain protein